MPLLAWRLPSCYLNKRHAAFQSHPTSLIRVFSRAWVDWVRSEQSDEHSVGVLRPTRVSISTGFDLDEIFFRLMREGMPAPESLDGNIRKEVFRRRQERQRDCRTWLGEEGEVARESRAAIRKRIVIAHPSSPLGVVTFVS